MKKILLIILIFIGAYGITSAQDFVYTPKNPAFGGSSFNYNWLMSSAQAQNGYTNPEADAAGRGGRRDPLEDFKNSLNRQILNQISRNIIPSDFSQGGLKEGTFTVGDYTIDVTNSLNGVIITIIDLATGNRTVIEVPEF